MLAAVTALLLLAGAGADVSPIYMDDGRGHTVGGDHISTREMNEIGEDLLLLLGLHRRPRPVRQAMVGSAPRFLLDIYRHMVDTDTGVVKSSEFSEDMVASHFNITSSDKEAISASDTIVSFVNHGNPHANSLPYRRSQLLWFDLMEMPRGERQLTCVLRIFQQKREPYAEPLSLLVHQIMKGEDSSWELRQLGQHVLQQNHEGWLAFNISTAADLWTVFPDYNLGLYIEVRDESGEDRSLSEAGVVGSSGVDTRQPFLAAFLKQYGVPQPPAFRRRSKRTAQKRRRKERKSNFSGGLGGSHHPLQRIAEHAEHIVCQKQNLYVSFRDLGWEDWIIAPEGYAAFFCTGLCEFPLNSRMNATNHAIVQTLTHLLEPFNYPKPSCAPTQLTAISVLYFDDNSNVILKKYPNMVATSCGCH